MEACGLTADQISGQGRAMAIASVGALFIALGLAMLVSVGLIQNLTSGMTIGAVAGIVVAGSAILNGVYEDRHWKVTLLFATYEIVALTAMGALIGFWR